MKTVSQQAQKQSIPVGLSLETLVEKLTAKDRLLEDRDHLIEQKSHVIDEQKRRIAQLEEYLRLEKSRRYGPSSEKHPGQGELFNEAEQIADEAEQPQVAEKPVKKSKAGRKGLSDKLPREQVYLKLTAAEKEGATNTFYSKIKEELDIIPARVRVLEYMQEKAVFAQDSKQTIIAAAQPAHPLGKSIASVGLLAYIIVAKYCDALPLYRLEKILERYGGSITRTSMANWIIRLFDTFMPLINLMKEHQLESDYLQADETRIQVLKEPGRAATSDKWMWLIRGGPPDQPVVVFEYDASRSAEVPLRLLEGFSGTLQTDGYAGYNKVCRENDITRIGCWDHARRKFVDAIKGMSTKQKRCTKVSKADVALSKIRKLYAIEDNIKSLSPKERYEQRQQQSLPILKELHSWLEKNISKLPKDSLTYTAMYYTLNQWETLIGYCENGHVRISNALAENAIRPMAVGRRNWLFSDTPKGAQGSATCYSLIETAKANGLEPYDYLHHVLQHIAAADTVEKLEALLPWNIKKMSATV
ncbi:MAG: IS66 family transposase [Gammaproteobacteria bacterium]